MLIFVLCQLFVTWVTARDPVNSWVILAFEWSAVLATQRKYELAPVPLTYDVCCNTATFHQSLSYNGKID